MDGGSDQPTRTISDVALSCIEMFHVCLSRDRNAFAKLEGDERRFWAWSNSLKVFEEQHINLDAQLKKHAQIREMVLLLLGVLKDNLSLAFNCEVSPEVSDRDVLEIPFFGIDGSLRRLEKIGTAIAHATHASLTRRVLLYAKKQDDYQELSRTFSLSILFRYRGLGPDDMPMFDVPAELIPSPDKIMAPQPPGLFLSLIKTSLVRHYRICYQRNKIEKDSKKPAPQVVSVKNIKPPEVDLNRAEQKLKQPDNLPHKEPPELNPGHKTQSEAMSNTLTLETAVFKKKLGEDASSSGSRAARQPVSEAGAAIIPRPPKMSDGQKSGICPICRQTLPANIFESRLSWISHVYKDIKPYVCISEECMSNLQFFEDSSSWINHMHKTHTTHWVQYLHNTYHWNCPVCHDVSFTEFPSKQEMEQDLIDHLEQDHSAVIEESNRRHLASVSGVPRHRPLDTCPICGTHHQLMPLSGTPDMPHNHEANYEKKDAAGSKVGDSSKATSSTKNARFEDSPVSDSEERKKSTKINPELALQPPDVRFLKPTRLTRVEKCIGDHLKGIAFYFSSRLIEDEYEDGSDDGHKSSAASKASIESALLALTDLSSVGSKADPPHFPPAHYDGPVITDKEKEEVKLCIARNSKELLESYKWDDNRRVEDLKLSSAELENMFPDTNRKSNDHIWKGMDPRYALAYVACLVVALELCKKALVAIDKESNDIWHIHKQLKEFSNALEDFPGRDLDTKFDPRGYLTAIDECALESRALFEALGVELQILEVRLAEIVEIRDGSDPQHFSNDKLRLGSDPWHFSDFNSSAYKENFTKIERTVRLRIVLADINGRFGDIDMLEDHELPSSLSSKARNLINQIVFELTQRNPANFQAVGGRVQRYLDQNIPIFTYEDAILADLIVGSYAKGVFDNPPREFLPRSFLSEFITEASVAKELEEDLDVKNDSDLVRFIVESAKKVFATAIISNIDGSNLYMLMKRFQADKFNDRCLPLKRETMLALPCFQGKFWNKLKTHNFLRSQWVFLAPVFSKSQFKMDLEPEHIFPFTWVSNDVKEGTFSNVYQVTIHKSHQEDPTWTIEGRKANVAIKEIKELKEVEGGMDRPSTHGEEVNKEWEAEAKALDDISGLNHRNIIQRIAAIKRGKKRYFMFQWADGGSLRDFWKDNPRPKLDPGFIKEIVMQLRGLADALYQLHTYNGSYCHGDLKPETILRFKDATCVGVLKIAVMGRAKHHTALTYMPSQTSIRYEPARYEPPEVVTHKASEEGRSRLYDIWSMGCITLEFIVWLLYGYNDLMKFNDSIKSSVEESSPYFKVGNDNVAQVQPVVRACMDHISKDPECIGNGGNTAIRDLLHIVKTNLLVVHLPQHRASNLASIAGNVAVIDTDSRLRPTYRPIGPTRATAAQFFKLLDDMIGKEKGDESYWYTGISRENLKGPPSRMIPSIVTNDFLSPESANRPNQLVDRTARRRETTTRSGLSTQLAPSSKENVSNSRCRPTNLHHFLC